MAAANFSIPPPAKFDLKAGDWDHWIKRYYLKQLRNVIVVGCQIKYALIKAADIYASFKLSGEDIQRANVK